MNLVIDIGNTRTKLCLFDGRTLVAQKIADGCTLLGTDRFLAETQEATEQGLEGAIVSTTADLHEDAQRQLAALPCPVLPFTSATHIPIANHYGSPGTLGMDRLAAAIGAWEQKPGRPLLIIDAGTCITIDFVSAEGAYKGGNISPGMQMRLQAMSEHTAHLPLVLAQGETPELGYDTETAIRAGVIRGIRHETEGYMRRYMAKYPDLYVFLTGGDAISLADCRESRIFADPLLVARGLNCVLNHNLQLLKKPS